MKRIADFSHLARRENIEVNLEPSEYARNLFVRFSIGLQRRIVQGFEHYVEAIDSLQRNSHGARDSLRLTWSYLRSAGLSPHSTAFSKIQSDETIEIFNKDYLQIFRSLDFFDHFQLPLFDVLILDRMTVLKSTPQVEEKVFLEMKAAFRSKGPSIQAAKMPDFECWDRLEARPSSVVRVEPRFRGALVSRKTRKVESILLTSRLQSERQLDLPQGAVA